MAIAQGGMALWGWQLKSEAAAAVEQRTSRTLPPVETIAKPVAAPIPRESEPEVTPPPPTPEIISTQQVTSRPKNLPPTKDVPITDEAILNYLEAGLEARQKGDMAGALGAFRSAWQAQPDHPKLIYQVAKTLDMMGLSGKAQPHWFTLLKMGHEAGDYFSLAEMHLKNKAISTPGPADIEEREERIQLADVKLENLSPLQGGQKKLLSFTIKKQPSEEIKSEDIGVAIHFFDLQNLRKIDRTIAAKPSPVMISTAEDWEKRGIQRLEVMYDLAEMSVDDVRKWGNRKFYGYVLELYLKDSSQPDGIDRLQDLVAEPPELANFAREMPIENPADQSPPAPPSNAADASLFPQ